MDITRAQTRNTPLSSVPAATPPPATTDFSTVLQHTIESVNDLQTNAEVATRDFVLGRAPSLHDTILAMEKADVSLRLLVQVRNKAVEAYQELMRMQL
jgi:flagellar hook-basal body complex protein FliE